MANSTTFTPTHKALIAAAVAVIVVTGAWSTQSSSSTSFKPVPAAHKQDQPASSSSEGEQVLDKQIGEQPSPDTRTVEHEVKDGDTLSRIFDKAGAPQSDLHRMMKADVEYLALETLRPGTTLRLTFDENDEFSKLALEIDAARTVFFTKTEEDTFEYHNAEKETHWVQEVLRGQINGSFYTSAIDAGLSQAQIVSVHQLLKHQLNFQRELRAGDTFSVIIGYEMTGEQNTGKSRIEAVTIEQRNQSHMAFRHEDGNYYNQDGKSVLPAFRRWPTPTSYRVSSSFNPNRLHPVTGRRSPHNGTDLATPTGTPILTTGDGVVDRVGNHRYAGKYIDVDHGNAYKTRYLHLSKILVKRGERVERGQRIALSGNTGRSTGAHLHFELHINGRPVNAMKAEIPTAADVPKAAVAQFKKQAEHQLAVMSDAASRSNLMLAGIDTDF